MHEHHGPLTTLADQIGVLPMTTSFASPGSMNVDWEERWNVERLRSYRLGRAREALAGSDVGALLLFDFNNIRYVTSTHIGEWARDKMTRYALLTRGGDPHIWDFGSAAKHHRINCPWLRPENIHAGMVGLRGAVAPDAGLFRSAAKEIRALLDAEGVGDMPVGVDIMEPPMLAALSEVGITVRDGQQTMLDAREVKSKDEIILLNTACAMVDGAYQLISEQLKPGVRESELVANVTKALFDMGSEHVDNINAVSGERCSPHPHVFSDRIIRPGDQAFFDIIHTFVGYKTCYYRTFVVGKATDAQRDAYKQAREWIDASIELMRPGMTTDKVASVWPKAEEFGFDQRDGVLRPPVRPQRRPVPARTADHQPAELARSSRGDQGGHGHRPRDLLPGQGRLSPPRGSRRRSSSLPTARWSSPCSRPTSYSSPTPTEDGHSMAIDRRRRSTATSSSGCIGPWSSAGLFEVRAQELFFEGLVRGTTHLGVGQEAVAAGFAAAMRDDDYTFCTYRGHNHTLARGVPMAPIFAELFGRATGLMGGKGGSMHLTSVEHGAMGSYAIVGAHLPIALGAAWSAQYRKSGQVAVCFFGDGTTNIGAFHEALNMAAVWKPPVVFVCENNQYMEYTPIARRDRGRPAGRRPGLGLRPRADRRRRQRRRRRVRAWPGRPSTGPAPATGRR